MNQIILNGTEVKVEEIQGKTVITIETENADVVVNDNCIWSKYDQPEYMNVPVVLRDFIYDRNTYLAMDGDLAVADLNQIDNYVCATFYMPNNQREAVYARLDLISSMEDLEDEYLRNRSDISEESADELIKEFKELFASIEQRVQEAGYRLSHSHDSGDFLHGWWDISFTLDKWNEEKFLAIWNAFNAFDKKLREVLTKYPN